MTEHNVISLTDHVAANPDNRDTILNFLHKRDAINAWRAYPDGRDIGSVPQSDGEILEQIDADLASALRNGDLKDLDAETYTSWLQAVDNGHDTPLAGYNAYEFGLKLQAEEAQAARRAEVAAKQERLAGVDGGEDAGQKAVQKLRAQWREEKPEPSSGGKLKAMVLSVLSGRKGADHDGFDAG